MVLHGEREGGSWAAELLLGSVSAVSTGRCDNAAGFATLSASPLFQHRAGSGILPCLRWDRAGC